MDAVTSFVRHYFQLGFIPKQMFMERLRTDHRSISPFLLLGIISISARFTPSLVKQYRTGVEASEAYIASASRLALKLLYDKPSLQTCQGFYLLSIAQQGSGLKNASFVSSIRFGNLHHPSSIHMLTRTYYYRRPLPAEPRNCHAHGCSHATSP